MVIWALTATSRLSGAVRGALQDPANDVRVSAVACWEMAIKQSLGKLALPGLCETWLPEAIRNTGFSTLHISVEDVLRVRALPYHHRDPFDRLLIAQAAAGWTIVTHDAVFDAYGVSLLKT